LFTLLFLDNIPLRDSILIAREPGSFPPLPKMFVEALGLLNRSLFDPEFPRPTLIAAGLCVKPSKKGCLRAYAAVILFCGSNVSIFIIRSIAYSEPFGMS